LGNCSSFEVEQTVIDSTNLVAASLQTSQLIRDFQLANFLQSVIDWLAINQNTVSISVLI